MKSKLLLCLAVAGLAIASAKSYSFSLYQPAQVGATQLKAGDYKIEIMDQKAVISGGKTRTEVPVRVESNGSKYASTSVRFDNSGGTYRIQEIHLGGTTTKLVFAE